MVWAYTKAYQQQRSTMMYEYRVSYELNGQARSTCFLAESEGEAAELFDEWAASLNDIHEILNIVEIEQ